MNSSEIAALTIRVRSRGEAGALAGMAYQLAKAPLAERRYLTYEELEAGHGARADDLDRIEQYAQRHNLTVARRSAAERQVVLRGRLGDLLSAFHADVQMYHHAGGAYRGRRGEIDVPVELKDVVTGIFGFDTRPKHRAPTRMRATPRGAPGALDGQSPAEFAARYRFPTMQGATALDGEGQTIAIVELGGGFRNSDLQLYFQKLGLPFPTVTAVSVDSVGNAPGTPDSADGEVMLDIEVAGAVAPKAAIAVYFAPNEGDRGFIDAISAAVHDRERKPGIVSISWGSPESGADPQSLAAYHEIFAAAGSLGVTVCVASGDHGTADQDAQRWDGGIHVDHPACDDLALACGGTQIDPESGEDVVWNDGSPLDPATQGGGGWASGGGISAIFAVPEYQAGLELPLSLDTRKPGRGVPDVAMNATNYFTRVDTREGVSGGTSAVAPLMAALVARLNQALGKNVGFLNPVLYANAKAAFTDVVRGTNAVRSGPPGYLAGLGWDACTGLGAPVGEAVLAILQRPPPAQVATAE